MSSKGSGHFVEALGASSIIQRPSKTLMVLLQTTPLGLFGFDRIYAGCIDEGLVKMGLAVTSFFIAPLLFPAWLNVLLYLALVAVSFYDSVTLMFNALSLSTAGVFCKDQRPWHSNLDIRIAFYVSLISIVFTVYMLLGTVAMALLMGTGNTWDSAASFLGVENLVADSSAISQSLAALKRDVNNNDK